MPTEATVPAGDLTLVSRARQSLWLDNLGRAMLSSGVLRRWGSEPGVSGLTSNPSLLARERWAELAAAGARPQWLLWASTSTTDAQLPPPFYARALVLADTIDTLPEATLEVPVAGPPHRIGTPSLGEAEKTLGQARAAGPDLEALGQSLQVHGAERFAGDWTQLLTAVGEKVRRPVPGAVG